MKKKVPLVSRLLQAGSIATMTLLSSAAQAKIPPVAFNKITGYFTVGKEYLSPTIGEVALESGLIYNFRFCSNAPKDPTANLVKALFPSPAGHITPTVGSDSNFGFHVKDPKTVALLLNYTNDLRDGKTDKSTKVRAFNEIIDSIRSEEDREVEAKIQKAIADFAESTKADFDELKSYKKNEQKKINSKTKELVNKLLEQLNSQVKTVQFRDAEIKKVIKALKISPSVSAFNIFQNEILKGKLPAVSGVLEQIDKSITQEKEGFYPNHTTEQILTAFLCEKFDAEDLVPFLKALDDEIVPNKQAIPDKIDFLSGEDVTKNAQNDDYSWDDLFLYDIQGLFSANIPFKSGVTPSSNGTTYFYNRDENRVVKAFDFQDCTETVLRQLVSMIVFNPLTKTYDISSLDEIKTPYIDNLRRYLNTYSPAQANNGDVGIRSDWNKVVGDLNARGEKTIQYLQSANEIKPGFVNTLRIFEKILGLTLPSIAKDTSKVEWVKTSFEEVFKTLHPNRTYKVDVQNLKEEEGDVFGDLNVNVFENEEQLFSFSATQFKGHAYIKNVFDEGQERVKASSTSFSPDKIKNIKTSDTAESLWLLTSQDLQKDHITFPLYQLFSVPLQDNDSRIQFLEELGILSEKDVAFIDAHSILLQNTLTQVLNSIGWDDPAVREKASPVILGLISQESFKFKEILFTGVKGLDSDKDCNLENFNHLEFLTFRGSQIKSAEGLESLKNLREFEMSRIKNLKTITFSKANEKLKKINLSDSRIEKIEGLESLNNLSEINVSHTMNLRTLTFSKANEKLEKIDLKESAIEKVGGLDSLDNLRELTVSQAQNLKHIIFSKANKKLEKIDLFSTNVEKIEGFDSLDNLRELILSNNNIEAVDFFKSNKNLKSVHIQEFSKMQKINGLEFLENLRKFDLRSSLSTVTFSPSHEKLEDVTVIGSNIEGLEFLKNLSQLFWENDQPLKTFSFSQSHEKLEKVNLKRSHIEKIEGLDFLTNLQELNLSETKGLVAVSLSGLHENLKDVNLKYSVVKELIIPNLPKVGTLTVNVEGAKKLETLQLKRGIKLVGIKNDDARIKWLD